MDVLCDIATLYDKTPLFSLLLMIQHTTPSSILPSSSIKVVCVDEDLIRYL